MAHHNYSPKFLPTFLILVVHQVAGEPAKSARTYFQSFIEPPAKGKHVKFRGLAIAWCSYASSPNALPRQTPEVHFPLHRTARNSATQFAGFLLSLA